MRKVKRELSRRVVLLEYKRELKYYKICLVMILCILATALMSLGILRLCQLQNRSLGVYTCFCASALFVEFLSLLSLKLGVSRRTSGEFSIRKMTVLSKYTKLYDGSANRYYVKFNEDCLSEYTVSYKTYLGIDSVDTPFYVVFAKSGECLGVFPVEDYTLAEFVM